MTQFIINYLTVDAVASVLMLALLYARRNQIKQALRIWLEIVPAPPADDLPEGDDENYDEEGNHLDGDYPESEGNH